MSKFKVGDKVKVLNKTYQGHERDQKWIDEYYPSRIGTVMQVGNVWVQVVSEKGSDWTFVEADLELLTINYKSIMKTLSNYYKKFTDADTQALVRAGYLNGDLEPTSKAESAIKEITFFANKDELVKRAKEEIAEEEKAKN
jgi:hypothetical protein